MADPLSVAASIIAVLQLAQSVVQGIQAVKDSSKERKTVRDEVIYLSGLLFNLKGGLERHELNQELLSSLDTPLGPLSQLKDALEQLSKMLIPSDGLKKVGRTISWAFQKEKIDDLLRKIERQKTFILFALENNQLELSHNIRRDVQQLMDGMDNIQNAVSQLDIHLQETLDRARLKQTEETLAWLSPLNFPLKYRDFQAKMEAGTCQWFLSSPEFESWRSRKWPTLWCTGPPGVGKTCLASAIITDLQQNIDDDEALAYVYCDYKDQTTQSVDSLLASILQQLSQRHTFVREAVSTMYAFHNKRRTRPVTSQWLELLQQEFQLYSKVYVVVDALDEYGETDDDRHALVASLIDLKPQIQLLVTSRIPPSRDLPVTEEQIMAISGSDNDIRGYLVAQIQRRGRLARLLNTDDAFTERLVHEVTQSAKGMFLLAKLQLDLLAQSHTKRVLLKNLEALPIGLDQLYDQTISRIMEQADADETLARSILTLVADAYRPLSLTELQHALVLHSDASVRLSSPTAEIFDKEDAVGKDIIVSVCLGLITIQQESDEVRLVHLTLQSYLEHAFAHRWPDARVDVARTCLACITSSDLISGPCRTDKEMTARLVQHPFLGYVGRYWGRHVHESATSIDSQTILEIVTPDTTRQSVVQIMHLPSHERELFDYSSELELFDYSSELELFDYSSELELFDYSSELDELERAEDNLPQPRKRREGRSGEGKRKQINYSQLYPRHVTALHISSSFGLVAVVKSLLQGGASIHAYDTYG
jgi:GTPase SAR1 family protein